jgi:L-threonylcarbamoyladenylate synthase
MLTSDSHLSAAAHALLSGELVAIPTETVYGLGADASNPIAVNRIYEVKGRPADHPLIVHVAALERCGPWVDDVATLNRLTMLGKAFWPGPLTMIVPLKKNAPAYASAGQSTVGLRVPAHSIATILLNKFHELGGLGIAAPSANRFGKVSPTSAAHVRADLGSDVPWVIDGGDCEVGLESTIVDLCCTPPRILRPGAISSLEISQCLDQVVLEGANNTSPRVSGSLVSHYAPDTPLKLLSTGELMSIAPAVNGRKIGIWANQNTCNRLQEMRVKAHFKVTQSNPKDYAHELYAVLRSIDTWGVSEVFVERPPDAGMPEWGAVIDRLQRASYTA